jgi:hypothetical protein
MKRCADYAQSIKTLCIVVEAKKLSVDVKQRKEMSQVAKYAFN